MVCDPTERLDVLMPAVPPLNATGAPRFTPLSANCTVPVGVPIPGATTATVAVKVTGWPNADGVTDELTVVAVFALSIWTAKVAMLLWAPKLSVTITETMDVAGPD